MAPDQTNLLHGTLDMMIFKALALAEMHGLGISRHIKQITKGTFQVKPGSLFPALHRMEEEAWLVSYWGESENRRRQVLQADRSRTPPAGGGLRQRSRGHWNPPKGETL